MKLYYFNRGDVLSSFTKAPKKIYEAEAVEKEKTYIVTHRNGVYGWVSTVRVRKETMEYWDYRYFLTIEEAKQGLLETIQRRVENDRKRAEELLADADRLEKILNEGE